MRPDWEIMQSVQCRPRVEAVCRLALWNWNSSCRVGGDPTARSERKSVSTLRSFAFESGNQQVGHPRRISDRLRSHRAIRLAYHS
jgi:hypothetical protein